MFTPLNMLEIVRVSSLDPSTDIDAVPIISSITGKAEIEPTVMKLQPDIFVSIDRTLYTPQCPVFWPSIVDTSLTIVLCLYVDRGRKQGNGRHRTTRYAKHQDICNSIRAARRERCRWHCRTSKGADTTAASGIEFDKTRATV